MEQTKFNYSMKNIPTPLVKVYMKHLVEKVESVVKRMRWKAFFFLKGEECDEEPTWSHMFGFKTRRCPPQIEGMRRFEDDMLHLVENIKFRDVRDSFQKELKEDIKSIKRSDKILVPAGKTRNFYKVEKSQYEKLLRENITKSYKQTSEITYDDINVEARAIAHDLGIGDRMDVLAKKQAFITLKDHKNHFRDNPTCRLINPTKSEMGRVSKQILDRSI